MTKGFDGTGVSFPSSATQIAAHAVILCWLVFFVSIATNGGCFKKIHRRCSGVGLRLKV
ncbi:hypothetical protein HanXRQr2_Chr17g0797781 [Helianthus annuus]|uniref:Uncharacterized protein n=1 Tax=Helianthus annuus TaxID=4232 RepID=A0A9K3DHZ9_HELAN|nr:hypothetical protein HanXRQr2_Chr17g0797781 [Helianthus annuus]KAJ0812759.1 hypothetical protein HanPSC8_Chr17g0765541 [Helianthus annuus]